MTPRDMTRTPAPLRLAFALAWIAAQLALILTAGRRADAAFGFRMFAESSTISAHLSRVVEAPSGHGTITVPVVNGEWIARDSAGHLRRIKWQGRVIEQGLATFDVTMQASYSAAAQLARWEAALGDVAAHLGAHPREDAETKGLVLDLTVRKNGHELTTHHFARDVTSDLSSDRR